MRFNDLIIRRECARLHLLFGGSGSSRHIATTFPSYVAAAGPRTPLRASVCVRDGGQCLYAHTVRL